jgi:hypothetical protein
MKRIIINHRKQKKQEKKRKKKKELNVDNLPSLNDKGYYELHTPRYGLRVRRGLVMGRLTLHLAQCTLR